MKALFPATPWQGRTPLSYRLRLSVDIDLGLSPQRPTARAKAFTVDEIDYLDSKAESEARRSRHTDISQARQPATA